MPRESVGSTARLRHALRRMLAGLCLLACATCWAAAPAGHAADWNHLSPQQRQALAPLRERWPSLSAVQRKKWLNIAARYPALSAQQRDVLQRRIGEWVRMTPRQRRLARQTFLATGRAPLQSRRRAWEDYQKLSPAQRREFERQARKPPHPPHVVQYGLPRHAPAPYGSAAAPRAGAAAPRASAAAPRASAAAPRASAPSPAASAGAPGNTAATGTGR